MGHIYYYEKVFTGIWVLVLRVAIILALLLLLTANTSFGMCHNSTGNGNWENSSTWTSSSLPVCGDTITILAGHIVTVSSNNFTLNSGSPVVINIFGTLNFDGGKKLNLACGSVVNLMAGSPAGKLTAASGGGASNQLNICDQTVWQASQGNQTGPLTFIGPLPVQLLFFKGSSSNSSVTLNWATASELNNSHFTIERSLDGKVFSKVGNLKGKGTCNFLSEYSFNDKITMSGDIYYRLTQTDYDGKFEIFDVITVRSTNRNAISLYPNPSDGIIYLNGLNSEIIMIKAYDLSGKLIYSRISDGSFSGQVDLKSVIDRGSLLISVEDEKGNGLFRQMIMISTD